MVNRRRESFSMNWRHAVVFLGLLLAGGAALVRAEPTSNASQPDADHPLDPALRIARKCLANIETNIRDYSATLIKRESIGGKLNETERMRVKIRHQPFSVYLQHTAPESVKGQEVVYVRGKNDGNLIGRPVGLKGVLGTLSLKPDGVIAMQGQRYPITEIGILNLTNRLIEAAESGKKFGDCEVRFFKGAKINKRSCTRIEVVHSTRRPQFDVHRAQVFFDDELNIPVRYEAYDWPDSPGGKPKLIEEYTYLDVKLNNDFGDADFELD